MKKLTLSLLLLFGVFLISCTEDETIEEYVHQQENPNIDYWSSGEEGDQDLDRKNKD